MGAPTIRTTEDQILLNKRVLKEAHETSIVNSWFAAWATDPNSPRLHSTQAQSSEHIQTHVHDITAKEDDEDFSAESDTGGLDYVKPKTSTNLHDRQNLNANDRLRRQMLGKNHRPVTTLKPSSTHSAIRKRANQRGAFGDDDNDNDEDEARTKATAKGTQKQKQKQQQTYEPTQQLRGTVNEDASSVQQHQDGPADPPDQVDPSPIKGNPQAINNSALTSQQAPTTTKSETPQTQAQTQVQPKKRKAGTSAKSYLDEMLAKRTKKKK